MTDINAMLRAIDGVLEWAEGYKNVPAVSELRKQRDRAVEAQEALLDRLSVLSKAQLTTAIILAKGYTNKEAGAALGVSARTVEVVRATVLKKLGLDGTPALAVLMYRAGYLGDGDV